MKFTEFIAGADDDERRLDKIVRNFCPQLNLSTIYKAIRKGLIKVNNKKTKQEYHVKENDCLQIASFLLEGQSEASNIIQLQQNNQTENETDFPEINILLKNDDLLFINKPYNYVVHGNPNDKSPSLDKIIQKRFSPDNKQSLSFKIGPLHRLDKKTTGILAFSQSLTGARKFSSELQTHKIQKKYIGIAEGHLAEEQHWIDDISTNNSEKNNSKKFHTVKIEKTDDSKTAETFAEPLFYGSYKNIPITIVQYYIKTGRTHQIRSQTSKHGFPLLGDSSYGGTKIINESREFYLHAAKLIFLNPDFMNTPSEINCLPDKDFITFITKTCGMKKIEL